MCFPEKSDRLQLLQDLHYNYISCHNRHGRELPIDELHTIHTALFVNLDLKEQLTFALSLFLYNETLQFDLCVVVFYVCVHQYSCSHFVFLVYSHFLYLILKPNVQTFIWISVLGHFVHKRSNGVRSSSESN